jgi:hypothetical protein
MKGRHVPEVLGAGGGRGPKISHNIDPKKFNPQKENPGKMFSFLIKKKIAIF